MTRTLQLCASLLLCLSAASTQAQSHAGSEFEIELIVFSRPNGMNQARETWPAAPNLQYARRWVDFQSPAANDPSVPLLVPVPTQLNNKVAALKRGGAYRVLFHKAWRQVLQEKKRAPAILISGGDSFRGHNQLEGSITLGVSQYLQLSSNLWLSEFSAQSDSASPGNSSPGVLVPARPQAAASAEPLNLMASDSGAGGVYASHVALLQDERRMRSGELHYIDHPLLGVLIEVRKVGASE